MKPANHELDLKEIISDSKKLQGQSNFKGGIFLPSINYVSGQNRGGSVGIIMRVITNSNLSLAARAFSYWCVVG